MKGSELRKIVEGARGFEHIDFWPYSEHWDAIAADLTARIGAEERGRIAKWLERLYEASDSAAMQYLLALAAELREGKP